MDYGPARASVWPSRSPRRLSSPIPLPRYRAAPEEETVVGRVDGPKVRTWSERSMSSARGSIKGFGSASGFRARNQREYSGYTAQPQSGRRAAWKCSKTNGVALFDLTRARLGRCSQSMGNRQHRIPLKRTARTCRALLGLSCANRAQRPCMRSGSYRRTGGGYSEVAIGAA